MALKVHFAAGAHLWPRYREPLAEALREIGIEAEIDDRCDEPAEIDYVILANGGTVSDFSGYGRARAALNLWAGVEKIAPNPTLTMPLCRMVDEGLEKGMIEWVCGHVLRHHLGMDAHITAPAPHWNQHTPPLAQERKVTVLGLGELGRACAGMLATLGFDVTGWSRRPRDVPGIRCLSGADGLVEALRTAEILVTLLPLTDDTRDLLDADRLALLPPGAVVINPGRGALIDDQALLAALDAGLLAHATLDVFRIEPLPADHPFWAHPRVTVTPHVAAETRAPTASRVIAENIRRGEAGEPFLYLVDRAAGY